MNRSEVLKKQIQYYAYAINAAIFLSLSRLLGNTGLAYIAIGLETISILLIFCSEYVADVYTKMIRYRRKRKQYQDVIAIRKRILVFEFILGIILLISAFFFADVIAEKIFHVKQAALIIRILSPVLFLRALENYYIGYIQSFGGYLPIAISCLFRQIFFLIFAKGIVKSRMGYGEKVADLLKNEEYVGMYAAVGVAISLLICELLIFIAILIYYLFANRDFDRTNMERNLHKSEALWISYREFILLNGTGIYVNLLKRILILVPFIMITNMQTRGIWYGKYLMLASIPVYLIISRLVYFRQGLFSIIRNRDTRMSREYIQTGMKYTWSMGLLVSLLLAVLAPQIVGAYFPNDIFMLKCLQYGAVLILLVAMIVYFVMIHMSHHRKLECFITLAVTAVLFLILNRSMFAKLQKPEAVIYASIISLTIGMLLLGILTIILYGVNTEYITVFLLPLVCVGVTCLIVLLVAKYMTPHIGNHIGCIVGIVLGIVLYVGSLSFCRVFDETDIKRLYGPIGRKLLSFVFR